MATLIHLPFKNKTLFYSSTNSLSNSLENEIWQYLQRTEGAPADFSANFHLKLDVSSLPFLCRVECKSGLKGGKGGFGTLLKGQSKQAAAKLTTNFGACRDLNGQRLRHVNDEIRLQKWQEAKRRREAGLAVDELEEERTSSGIHGWHLAVPTWADGQITNKTLKASERKLKRELDAKKREEMQQKQYQEQLKVEKEQKVFKYANVGVEIFQNQGRDESLSFRKDDAIAKGMAAPSSGTSNVDNSHDIQPNKKRNLSEMLRNQNSTSIDWLRSLSGDVIEVNVEDIVKVNELSNDNIIYIQSQSEFISACIMFVPLKPKGKYYFEVVLCTGGVAQIGWAKEGFKPDSSNGDGVGDDDCSWGFDGFRQCKFSNGESLEYGLEWKPTDCLGCLYDAETGHISFQLNSNDLGIAYTVSDNDFPVYPALSLNEGEIIGIRVGPFFKHLPDGFGGVHVGIDDLGSCHHQASTTTSSVNTKSNSLIESNSSVKKEIPSLRRKVSDNPVRVRKLSAIKNGRNRESKPEFLDLNNFRSVEEIESIGLERLKNALISIGVKCGYVY